MEELFNELISIVTDRLSDLTDTINIDDIMQSATDAIQSTVEALSNADIDLDEDTKETLISRIIDSFDGGDTSTILDNLHFITENPLDGIGETSDIASQGMDFSSVADTGTVAQSNGAQMSFGSIGCWDECFATTQDHSKRLTCGYQY